MLKELLFTSYQPHVETVHVGLFPAYGAYFIKKMEHRSKNVFLAKVDLPLGKSYCHYFINEDFEHPVKFAGSNHQTRLSDRVPILLESEFFCPIEFAPQNHYLSPIEDGLWEIRSISHHGWIKSVSLLTEKGEIPLQQDFQIKNKKYWSLRFSPAEMGHLFVIKFGGDFQTRYLHRGYRIRPACDFKDAFSIKLNHKFKPSSSIPAGSIGYQVYPDSFCRADSVEADFTLSEWGSAPKLYHHFGGNFKGVQSRLDYLQNLGVDFLYFNPIFKANSAHRYDCTDYRELDPLLGTEKDLEELLEAIHARGMKFVLDIAVNHCSADFPPFQNVLEKQEDSPYRDWFLIQSYPVSLSDSTSYSSWGNFKDMPLFNTQNAGLREYLLESLSYWATNFAIDGWRLDVSTEIEESFVRQIGETLRAANPATTLIGECWYHLNGRRVVEKGKLHGLTNFSLYWNAFYPFFIDRRLGVQHFAKSLIDNVWSTEWESLSHSWTFLSNHDTPRFYSILEEKEWYPLAFALLYALPGKPLIYYGEEIGMEGISDPDNRACMDWEQAQKDNPLQTWLPQLYRLRKDYQDLLREGYLSIPLVDEEREILALQRSYRGEQLLFLFNFGSDAVAVNTVEFLAEPMNWHTVFPTQSPLGEVCRLAAFGLSIFSTKK